ncbi:MAG: hypothetical protein KF726_28760 [Anaerolineae bacterium]|nr:hypothetical protein [Anaerolineae bacterium]
MLIAATSATLLISGRAQSYLNPLSALGFRWCENKPCFHGIVLGLAQWKEVENVLSGAEYKDGRELVGQVNNLAVRALTGGRISTSSGPDSLSIEQRDYVDQIEMNVQFGDVILLYGAPCRAFYQLGSVIVLVYPTMLIQRDSPERYLRPHLSVTQILLVTDDFNFNYCEKLYRQGATWAGFQPIQRYE